MPVVHVVPAERQALAVEPHQLTSPFGVGRLLVRLFNTGATAYTFPPRSMINLVPDELQGRVADVWLKTYKGVPAERATAYILEHLETGPVHIYDSNTGKFTSDRVRDVPIPPGALPMVEASPVAGHLLHGVTLHLPHTAMPSEQIVPWPMPR